MFLARKGSTGLFCSLSCRSTGEHNSFYNKTHSDKVREIISLTHKGKPRNISEYVRKAQGRRLAEYNRTKHPNYKNGVYSLGIVLYDSFSTTLKQDGLSVRPYDLIIGNKMYKTLEVTCYHCGKWYVPDRTSVQHRVQKIRGTKTDSKCNLYCSEECKHLCGEYNKFDFPIDSKFEFAVYTFVNSIFNGDIVRNDRTQIVNPNTNRNLELDIWFPDKMKAIECNGVYWHAGSYSIKKDTIKKSVCKKKNISLLVVTDEEWYANINECREKIVSFFGRLREKYKWTRY